MCGNVKVMTMEPAQPEVNTSPASPRFLFQVKSLLLGIL